MAGTSVVDALLDALEDEHLERLAQRLAPLLPAPEPVQDGWLDTQAAARYLGIPPKSLQTLVAERVIEFSQERPGARCYFERGELDAYRRRHLHGRSCR